MKQIFRDKTILISFVVLLLCGVAIGYTIYSVLNPKPEVSEPIQYPLNILMQRSIATIFEHKETDGTITELKLNKDPVFYGMFDLEDDKYQEICTAVNTDQWLYRATYNTMNGKIVFLIGDGWFTLSREPDKVYTMQNMDAFLEGLSRTYENWCELEH